MSFRYEKENESFKMESVLLENIYKNNGLVAELLSSEYVSLSTVIFMNKIRDGERKVNDWVTKLEISGKNLDLVQKFPNIKELLIHADADIFENKTYTDLEINSVTVDTGMKNSALPVYTLPKSKDYINIDDIIILDKTRLEYYDDPFVDESIIDLVKNTIKVKQVTEVKIYTNSEETVSEILRYLGQGIQVTISPLDNSKYGDYLDLPKSFDKFSEYVKFEGFEYFDDNQSYLFKEKRKIANISEYSNGLYIIFDHYAYNRRDQWKDEIKEVANYFQMISRHTQYEKIEAKYNLYDSISSLLPRRREEDWLRNMSAFTSIIPLTLKDLNSFGEGEIIIIIRSGLLDLEKTLEIYEYLPKITYRTISAIRRYPETEKKIIDMYPEYKLLI